MVRPTTGLDMDAVNPSPSVQHLPEQYAVTVNTPMKTKLVIRDDYFSAFFLLRDGLVGLNISSKLIPII